MTPTQLIARKRDGLELTDADIADFIRQFTLGRVADYQVSAFAMAVYFQGMTSRETVSLTKALLNSGQRLNGATDDRPRVDKHSTGGIGDKISLVLAPLLACFDLSVPMISGRGLGPTGGTLDKLEAIPGFRTSLSMDEIQQVTQKVGCVISGASEQLAPADRKLYALRDVTATVASQPLIVSSILSKKLAEDLTSLVLDVKAGSGAFMKTVEQATKLGRSLVDVATHMGVKTTALVTNMDQPLGRMIGNANEVQEAVDVLKMQGETSDLLELTIRLGSELLLAERVVANEEQAHQRLLAAIRDGRAFEKFEEMVAAQGGDASALDRLVVAPSSTVFASQSGTVASINGQAIGEFVIELGGGRLKVTDPIDHSVGIEMLVRIGEAIEAGSPLLRVFSRSEFDAGKIRSAISISERDPFPKPTIIHNRLEM